jgi:hypothetical protein
MNRARRPRSFTIFIVLCHKTNIALLVAAHDSSLQILAIQGLQTCA